MAKLVSLIDVYGLSPSSLV